MENKNEQVEWCHVIKFGMAKKQSTKWVGRNICKLMCKIYKDLTQVHAKMKKGDPITIDKGF
jgi:hypothetical protein